MNVSELNQKIFTFDKNLTGKDLTKVIGPSVEILEIIKDLPSMMGINEEYLPKFKFFQFKKSMIMGNTKKFMLCFIDISQKILYDTSKAEGDLLSLINSTISHEMRNPLNSIINQGKITHVLCNQLMTAFKENSKKLEKHFSD